MTQTQTWPDDLPAFDETGTTIIRHNFGGPSALLVLVALLGLGLLVTHLIAADHDSVYSYALAPARVFDYSAAKRALFTRKTPDDDDWDSNPQRRAEKEAIEWYFRILDPNDAGRLETFLSRFDLHPYAERKGYARAARQALARVRQLESEAQEHRLRAEQQSVPWDMGRRPPKSFR